ncbi:Sec-independent protein translocase protein TatB [Vitreoscilla massiliensis]|uniref:Sec-independent protein translocase protein TatB n=1 Tax=Vitreoscilla massiliensis TaxID=1689272 RepID=A0ABY4E907_9NEIS|nr:Sec-independent protein translocase protein TatB [Vitreoscilla massiliensis]UOO89907.1 Sec-independent protein translocase protein TatB [Vitreoscilla massiliensis]
MFELSFGEILLFTIVALIVLGPERLPALARFLGRWMAKIQNLVHNVKAEISAEIAVDDLKQMRDEFQASAQTIREDIRAQAAQLQQVKQEVDDIPYWDKLPPQRRPEDFGLSSDDDDMAAERAWTAAAQEAAYHSGQHVALAQQSRRRRKDVRPYQHINRQAQRIGARRQLKQSRHG